MTKFQEFKVKAKVKAKKAWTTAKPYLGAIAIGGTIGAAWGGYMGAFSNDARLKRMEKQMRGLVEVVNNNADCQVADQKRLNNLERQNNLLFEEALKRTEGKAE